MKTLFLELIGQRIHETITIPGAIGSGAFKIEALDHDFPAFSD